MSRESRPGMPEGIEDVTEFAELEEESPESGERTTSETGESRTQEQIAADAQTEVDSFVSGGENAAEDIAARLDMPVDEQAKAELASVAEEAVIVAAMIQRGAIRMPSREDHLRMIESEKAGQAMRKADEERSQASMLYALNELSATAEKEKVAQAAAEKKNQFERENAPLIKAIPVLEKRIATLTKELEDADILQKLNPLMLEAQRKDRDHVDALQKERAELVGSVVNKVKALFAAPRSNQWKDTLTVEGTNPRVLDIDEELAVIDKKMTERGEEIINAEKVVASYHDQAAEQEKRDELADLTKKVAEAKTLLAEKEQRSQEAA